MNEQPRDTTDNSPIHPVPRPRLARWIIVVMLTLAAAITPGDARAADDANQRPRRPADRTQDERGPDDAEDADTAPGRFPGRRGPRFNLWARLSDEERQEVRDFVQEHFPEAFQEMTGNGGQIRPWFRRQLGGILDLMRLVEEEPERGKLMIRERRLEMQMTRLAHRYGFAAGPRQRELIRTRMTRVCGEWFDVRLSLRAMMIDEMEGRLETLKRRNESARTERDARIAKEVERRLEDGARGRPSRPGRPSRSPDLDEDDLDGDDGIQAVPRRRP